MRMDELPLISIVLPTHNSAATLKPVLDSIVNLDYPKDKLELIIVDDSSDETKLILNDFKEKYNKLFYKLIVIEFDHRIGVSKARNLGIINASGRYVFFLDSDVVLKKDILQKFILIMENCKKCGAISALYIHRNPSFIEKINSCKFIGRFRRGQLATGAVLIPMDIINKIGLFNEKLGYPYTIYEDWEYQVRIEKSGFIVLTDGREPLLHLSKFNNDGQIDNKREIPSAHVIKSWLSYFSNKRAHALLEVLKNSPWRLKLEYFIYIILLFITLFLVLIKNIILAFDIWVIVLILFDLYYIFDFKFVKIKCAVILGTLTLLSRISRAIGLLKYILHELIIKIKS